MAAATVGAVGRGWGPATPPAPGPAARPREGRAFASRRRVEVGRPGRGLLYVGRYKGAGLEGWANGSEEGRGGDLGGWAGPGRKVWLGAGRCPGERGGAAALRPCCSLKLWRPPVPRHFRTCQYSVPTIPRASLFHPVKWFSHCRLSSLFCISGSS